MYLLTVFRVMCRRPAIAAGLALSTQFLNRLDLAPIYNFFNLG